MTAKTWRPAAAFVAVMMVGCAGDAGEDPAVGADGRELPRVEMAVQPYVSGATFYIALKEGYFEDAGVDFRLRTADESGARSIPPLDMGRLDVLHLANLVGLVNAVDAGANVRAVAATAYFPADACGFSGLVARRGLFPPGERLTPESLRGRRVDLNPLTFEGYFIDTYLRRGGLSLEDIEPVYLPLSARMEAMDRGGIDMTVISEPWMSRMEAAGHETVLTVGEVVPDTQFGVLVFGSRLLEDDRETGRKVVQAYLRAVRQFAEGPTPRNVELVSEFTGLDPEEIRGMCWPSMRPDGGLEADAAMAYQRWAVERRHLERVVPLDEIWDPGFTGVHLTPGSAVEGESR